MKSLDVQRHERILLIDDNSAIHEDFRKILSLSRLENESMEEAESILFGESPDSSIKTDFDIDSAYQGREGLAMVECALESGRPYALAFVDMRMPPGWDGLVTIERLWEVDPDLQVVICTAYSDNSWETIMGRIRKTDQFLILKKPFDNIEVHQLAAALTEKWKVSRRQRMEIEKLNRRIGVLEEELREFQDVSDIGETDSGDFSRCYQRPSTQHFL